MASCAAPATPAAPQTGPAPNAASGAASAAETASGSARAAASPGGQKERRPADGAAANAPGTGGHASTAPDPTRSATATTDATPARRRLPAVAPTADRHTGRGSPAAASHGSAGTVHCSEPSTQYYQPQTAEHCSSCAPPSSRPNR